MHFTLPSHSFGFCTALSQALMPKEDNFGTYSGNSWCKSDTVIFSSTSTLVGALLRHVGRTTETIAPLPLSFVLSIWRCSLITADSTNVSTYWEVLFPSHRSNVGRTDSFLTSTLLDLRRKEGHSLEEDFGGSNFFLLAFKIILMSLLTCRKYSPAAINQWNYLLIELLIWNRKCIIPGINTEQQNANKNRKIYEESQII